MAKELKTNGDTRAIVSVVYSACSVANRNYVTMVEIANVADTVGISLDEIEKGIEDACENRYVLRSKSRFYELTKKDSI